jgi:hypothetical protein
MCTLCTMYKIENRKSYTTIRLSRFKNSSDNVIKRIRELAKKEAIEFTHHARTQMYKRKIVSTQVKQCLLNGGIIEEYGDDKPYPSFLLCAKLDQKYLHVVCSVAEKQLFIITTYYPDEDLWIAHKKRK